MKSLSDKFRCHPVALILLIWGLFGTGCGTSPGGSSGGSSYGSSYGSSMSIHGGYYDPWYGGGYYHRPIYGRPPAYRPPSYRPPRPPSGPSIQPLPMTRPSMPRARMR